ncbi:MAG: hypothetical protein JWR77_205 [Rhizorhabdus sp.]|nr:hypothetical protein [Rhizorhabdus sp.]
MISRFLWYFDRPLIREADALRDLRKWPQAAEAYRRILKRRPQRAGVWVQYGHCLTRMDRSAEAADAYREADLHRPDHAETIYHLGAALFKIGREAEARVCFDRVLALNPDRKDVIRGVLNHSPRNEVIPGHLDCVIIGTTGTCNASCVHCPTGKLETAHVPRTPMPMPLFRKIIDEIADSGLMVTGTIAFGLFGDALVDPFVVERARYVRERLPDALLSLNSNGAAYNPAKHAVLNEYASVFALHCESLVPETYNYLMQPLRLDRVQVKFPMIFRDFPEKVRATFPINQKNLGERASLRDYFNDLGAVHIEFAPMSNRCAKDDALFDSLAFAPVQIACNTDIFYNLIVDCDGTVLACCNDFQRVESVGNLSVDSLADTLAHQKRMAMRKKLEEGRHGEISTCSRCRGDLPSSIPAMTEEFAAA